MSVKNLSKKMQRHEFNKNILQLLNMFVGSGSIVPCVSPIFGWHDHLVLTLSQFLLMILPDP